MSNLIKQKTVTLAVNRSVRFIMIGLIFAAVLSYAYFANAAVRTLTVLEKTKTQIQSLNMAVSEMESTRLALENNLSTEKALRLGFVEVNNPIFIMKSAKKTALSLKLD